MGVFLLIKPEYLKIYTQLALYIRTFSDEVRIFDDPSEFYFSIRESWPDRLEYVLIDIRTFQSDIFNPYREISLMPNPVPVVVFNDPFPEPGFRSLYWLSKNREYFSSVIDTERIDALYDEFYLLESFLNDPKFNKYISVINRPEQFLTQEEKLLDINLENFRLRHKINPSRFKIFRYLYDNMGKSVSEKNLVSLLFNEYSEKNKKLFFSYIHDLKKACSRDPFLKINIQRISKGYYSMDISVSQNTAGKEQSEIDDFWKIEDSD